MKKYLMVLATMVCIIVSMPMMVFATAEDNDCGEIENLLTQFENTINNQDIEGYIELFTKYEQNEMREYLDYAGDTNFFKEKTIEIKDVTRLSEEVGKRSTAIREEEITDYGGVAIYYAEL